VPGRKKAWDSAGNLCLLQGMNASSCCWGRQVDWLPPLKMGQWWGVLETCCMLLKVHWSSSCKCKCCCRPTLWQKTCCWQNRLQNWNV